MFIPSQYLANRNGQPIKQQVPGPLLEPLMWFWIIEMTFHKAKPPFKRHIVDANGNTSRITASPYLMHLESLLFNEILRLLDSLLSA